MKRFLCSLSFGLLAGCGPNPPATVAPVAEAYPAKMDRLTALQIASQIYSPSVPSAVEHIAPSDDGFACDLVVVEETTLRACGRGPTAIDSLVAFGEHANRGKRYAAMASATKAIFDVVDPNADPVHFARVQREVAAATDIGGDNLRACTPAACVKVSASDEIWTLAATVRQP